MFLPMTGECSVCGHNAALADEARPDRVSMFRTYGYPSEIITLCWVCANTPGFAKLRSTHVHHDG